MPTDAQAFPDAGWSSSTAAAAPASIEVQRPYEDAELGYEAALPGVQGLLAGAFDGGTPMSFSAPAA